jgi:hypothetical protein
MTATHSYPASVHRDIRSLISRKERSRKKDQDLTSTCRSMSRSPMYSWLEGERWSWEDREIDEDVKKKIAYPECLEEDQEALAELLRVVRGRV